MRGKGDAVRSRRARGRGLEGDGTRPSRWGHATRAAWALGPATMMTIGSGSEGTLVCVAVGGCAVYVMDVTRQGEWAVFSAWASATAALGTLLGGRGKRKDVVGQAGGRNRMVFWVTRTSSTCIVAEMSAIRNGFKLD